MKDLNHIMKYKCFLDDKKVIYVDKPELEGENLFKHTKKRNINRCTLTLYDDSKPCKYIIYLDANNLYGWAMIQHLPTGNFMWNEDNWIEQDILALKDDSNTGYVFKVDLEYPKNLHDLHNDYPFCPERVNINGITKLTQTLNNKENYPIHYRALKQALRYGLKLKKVHKCIQFSQSAWLKKYIDFNTRMRKEAATEFEKHFFKLMNNSFFGRTMMNVRKHIDFKLACNEKQAKQYIAKPRYKHRIIFDENLVGIHLQKKYVTINVPIYLGMCILDLSKTLMYDFHYGYIKAKYGDKAQECYTDTDSHVYSIETGDVYKDIANDVKEWFDTSNYPENHPSEIPTGINKKVLGKFKDEMGGKYITEFICLCPKMYSFKLLGGKGRKKAKGVNTVVTDHDLRHQDYKDCLFDDKDVSRDMRRFETRKHDIYTVVISKKTLSSKNDKVVNRGFSTISYGHYKLKINENNNGISKQIAN